MVEMTEVKSFDELLSMLGDRLARTAQRWTAKQWQEVLQQSTRGMAQDILRHVPDMPRLVSVVAAAGGTSTFMTFESDECEFTITINATRKRPPMDAPTFDAKHRADNANESEKASAATDPERRESEPAWPFRKSDGAQASSAPWVGAGMENDAKAA